MYRVMRIFRTGRSLLQDGYHLIVPALPGYDQNGTGNIQAQQDPGAETRGTVRDRGVDIEIAERRQKQQ